MRIHLTRLCLILTMCLWACCGHTQTEGQFTGQCDDGDSLEWVNRVTFAFNRLADSLYIKPAYMAYDTVFPLPVKESVTNFVRNMNTVPLIASDILAGKICQAAQDVVRLVLNSTLGLAGLFDVATPMGFPAHKQDLGKTFYEWGWKQSNYFIIPILGPSTVRDALGLLGEFLMYPPQYWKPKWRDRYYAIAVVQRRGSVKDFEVVADTAGVNYYNLMRSGYLQYRQYILTDDQEMVGSTTNSGGSDMLGEPPL